MGRKANWLYTNYCCSRKIEIMTRLKRPLQSPTSFCSVAVYGLASVNRPSRGTYTLSGIVGSVSLTFIIWNCRLRLTGWLGGRDGGVGLNAQKRHRRETHVAVFSSKDTTWFIWSHWLTAFWGRKSVPVIKCSLLLKREFVSSYAFFF